ncbi:hypothetical protein FisN_16Hu009 [Fistulifera solaris]|uniref:subtilisin n=1 Tax=Fistulifera solaris TaxID=1519565 RepID=A0A1Z5KGE0_FISSO|nr:hypothetical protein FisN_16Hu009 [Fistulifera solaris]|eukprot:GAX25172.1 hypothetical protein FisN_16Hu009 [Fistulifera solaris]
MVIHRRPVFPSLARVFVGTLLLLSFVNDVKAQQSCSAPQSVQVPTSIDVVVEGSNDSGFLDDPCNAPTLPAGQWLSYTPVESRIVHLILTSTDSFGVSIPPKIAVYQGECEALSCIGKTDISEYELLVEMTGGEEYLIFIFSRYDDLPFQAEHSLVGALSDFDLDDCSLDGTYAVWYKYTTALPEEIVYFSATTRDYTLSLQRYNVIGVQSLVNDLFTCVAAANDLEKSVSWVAEANVPYYILVGDVVPYSDSIFTVTVESGGVPETSIPEPVSSPPVSAPDTIDEGSDSATSPAPISSPVADDSSPVAAPTTTTGGNSTAAPSVSGAIDLLESAFKTQMMAFLFLLWFLVA